MFTSSDVKITPQLDTKITPQADIKFATSNNIINKNNNSNKSFNKLKEHSSETLDSAKKL